MFQIAAVRRVQRQRQSAQMSKIKNGGLDQYDKALSLKGIGGERVSISKTVQDGDILTTEN